MPAYKVTHPVTGKTLTVRGDVPPSEAELDEIFAATMPIEAKGLDVAKQMAVSAVAEPVKGLVGLGTLLTGGGNEQANVNMQRFQSAREQAFPQSQQGQTEAQAIAENPVMSAIGKGMEYISKGAGNVAFEATGSPTAAAIAEGLPTVIPEVIGFGAGKAASSLTRKTAGLETPSAQTLDRQGVIQAGKEANIPVMTSDVFPPKTAAGKFLQDVSDKLGFIGTGGKRAKQQEARQEAVSGFVDNLGIELDSPFADNIIRSLNEQNKAKLVEASNQRTEAITALDNYGGVTPNKAIAAIDKQIAAQRELGKVGKQDIIAKLQDYKEELSKGSNFGLNTRLRTRLIKDKDAVLNAEDKAPAAIYSDVKKALDEDLRDFAVANDRNAAANWLSSNKKFFEELEPAKQTELKRLLDSGTATPEIVIPILKRGRPSELNRLYARLTPDGIVNAQKAIIQDVLKESKYFDIESEPNPTLFINALQKPNRQLAVKTFFKGNDAKAIDSLAKVLQKTRQAQSSQALPQTGAIYTAATPLAVVGGGGALVADGGAAATLAATGLATTAAVMKLYESKPFRNMLIKLANQDPKSAAYNTQMGLITAEIAGATAAELKEKESQKKENLPVIDVQQGFENKQVEPMQDPQAMTQQSDDFRLANEAIDHFGNEMISSYKVDASPRISAIDLDEIQSHPKEIGMQLLSELYADKPAYIPIVEKFIEADTKPEYAPVLQSIGNVLRNSGIMPPDDKEESIANMVAMGIEPQKAFNIANTIKTIRPQEAKKIADSIRKKISPEMYADFAPLISSIEALA